MKDQFVDYATANKLKELGFNEVCMAIHKENKGNWEFMIMRHTGFHLSNSQIHDPFTHVAAPAWQQVKQWLWEKHKMTVSCSYSDQQTHYYGVYRGEFEAIVDDSKESFDSPITAEIEGIKAAVEHLHEKLKT